MTATLTTPTVTLSPVPQPEPMCCLWSVHVAGRPNSLLFVDRELAIDAIGDVGFRSFVDTSNGKRYRKSADGAYYAAV